ncbi:37S ribosomal protein S22 [Exophiala xenobiotica]|nr:37S ribosomal protein S22 [Exophiala xenobiotica]
MAANAPTTPAIEIFYQGHHHEYEQTKHDAETGSEADSAREQIEALHELEKALGRPIEEAIEEDRALAQGLHDASLSLKLAPDEDVEGTVEVARGLLAGMRSNGASQEEVVQEARKTYGDRLPNNALNEEELKIYKRLYGDPISMSYEEFLDEDEATNVDGESPNQLYDQEGELVDYEASSDAPLVDLQEEAGSVPEPPQPAEGAIAFVDGGAMDPSLLTSPAERAQEVARSLNAEVLEDIEQEELVEEYSSTRIHPFTRLGKFATNPGNVLLSHENFVRPVNKIMSNFSNKHLKDMCEKTFGGPGLPDSPLTPRSGRSRAQIPLPIHASQHSMGEMEANAFLTTVMPPTYAAVVSVLVETRKRLGTTWLNKLFAKEGGPRILDAGAGGAGILAWREVIKAHWDAMHDSDRDPPPPPASKAVVLTGSDPLRHRAAALLENTTFVPRLPDYVHTRDTPTLDDDRPAQQRKQFDVIIATHTLFGLQEDFMKKQHVQNLWSMLSPEGGVLILIEKGVPRGFEAIAGARELLLERHIAVPEWRRTTYSNYHDDGDIHNAEPGMIIAPCTNHEKCPMYHIPGPSQGRKDFCSFQQRYTRPNYLQRVLGAKDRNHDDVDFSYISVMRGDDLRRRQVGSWQGIEDGLSASAHPDPKLMGEDYETWMQLCQSGFDDIDTNTVLSESTSFADGKARSSLPAPWNLPRLVFPPMKRRGHIIMDVCTPAGRIERWTVPRSFGKQAYHDARKSQWGDLWALGAKTRIPRSLRLGGPDTKEARRARSRAERISNQAEELMEQMEQEKLEELEEDRELARMFDADDEPVMMKAKSSQRANKAAKAKAQSAVAATSSSEPVERIETFSFGDFNEDEMNPVPPPTRSRSAGKSALKPSSANEPVKVKGEANNKDEHLTDEELATLEEWERELSSVEDSSGGRTKGVRTYSKFAPAGQKGRPRKIGKVPRVGRPAGGRRGL